MKLADALQDWLLCIVHEQGVSKTTRKSYAADVRRFLRWVESEGGYPDAPIEAFAVPVLRRFNYSLGKQGLKPTTVRGIFNGLRSFGSFLQNVGALPDNPATQIGMPKKNTPERTACTDAEVLALLDGCDRIANPRRAALAKAIVSTFAFCGLRRSELLDLCVQDINLDEGIVTVRHGKGDKSRNVPACAECVQAWREWLTQREQDAPCAWLFLENKRRRLFHDGLRHLFEEVKIAAGLRHATDLTPHVLRHSYATRLVKSNADLKSVQELLGHSSLIVTNRYVHGDAAHLREVASLASLKPLQRKQDDGKVIDIRHRTQNRERRLRRSALS